MKIDDARGLKRLYFMDVILGNFALDDIQMSQFTVDTDYSHIVKCARSE